MLILVSLIAVGPIIYLLILLRAKLVKDNINKQFPLPSCIWFVYGALLKQGSTLSPITDSSRLLFATWWIFITILTAFYTANLTAFLTLSKVTLPIEEAKDIVDKKYKWIAPKGMAIEEAVVNKQEELSFFNIKDGKFVTKVNQTEILENYVFKDNYVYIKSRPAIELAMYENYIEKTRRGVKESERCTFVMNSGPILTRPRAFAYSKDFLQKDLFDRVLQSLVEAGIVKHLERRNLPDTKICPKDLGGKGRQLHNSDLYTTYAVVVVGFIVSGTVFIGEVLLRAWKKFCVSNNFKDPAMLKYPFKTKDKLPPRPPSYSTLFQQPYPFSNNGKRESINGRNYWVVKSVEGDTRLIPVKTPSALLFQYTN